jgi:hypothetical protein
MTRVIPKTSKEAKMANGYYASRRRFLRASAVAGAALAAWESDSLAQGNQGTQGNITQGDIDILRLFAALEILETDFWVQYNELGGIQDNEFPDGGGTGNKPYTDALKVLDSDMDQYVHDNTDDEFTHFDFINSFLVSVGAQPVNLDRFRTLHGSTADGAVPGKLRLTNLTSLKVDTSWWTRYRDDSHNPDLDPNFEFPQAVPGLTLDPGFPAIPRNNGDTKNSDHIQAIANTAGFHFATIEQGGSSLYPTMALKVTSPVVLRILLSIGPTETMHFQTWQDKAGNAPPVTDPITGLVFPDLNKSPGGELFSTNRIMPEPCPFLSRSLKPCSVIRPVSTDPRVFGAMKAVRFLTDMGLFLDQSDAFFRFMTDLARKADSARRQ